MLILLQWQIKYNKGRHDMIHVPITYKKVLTATACPHFKLSKDTYFFKSVYLHVTILWFFKMFPIWRNGVRDGKGRGPATTEHHCVCVPLCWALDFSPKPPILVICPQGKPSVTDRSALAEYSQLLKTFCFSYLRTYCGKCSSLLFLRILT